MKKILLFVVGVLFSTVVFYGVFYALAIVSQRLHEPEVFVTSDSLSSPNPEDWIVLGGRNWNGLYISEEEAFDLVTKGESFHPTSVSEDWSPPFSSK